MHQSELFQTVVGPIRLPLRFDDEVQYFQLHYFDTSDKRWACASLGDISDGAPSLLRIESACLFGHVFQSQQCDCGFQLTEAIRRIGMAGRGLVIYGIDQDARGHGIESHFRIYDYRQNHHLDTEKVFEKLDSGLDARKYTIVAAILKWLGVQSIQLMSNNLEREAFLTSNGFNVVRHPLEAPLSRFNMATLMLEKEDLGYTWAFRTHADWLAPLQSSVANDINCYAGSIVKNNELVLASWRGNSWDVASHLVDGLPEADGSAAIVVYLTDLPRLDELELYARVGAGFVVVPFAELPGKLQHEAARLGLKLQDWERANRYIVERPQWTFAQGSAAEHRYVRGDQALSIRLNAAGEVAALLPSHREMHQ